MNKFAIVMLAAAGAAWAQDWHEIMVEVQKRQHSTSMRYEGTLYSCISPKGCPPNSKNMVTKRWVYERIGDFGKSKAMLRFTGPAEVKGVSPADREPSRRRQRSMAMAAGRRPRATRCRSGPFHALLRHRFQL